MNVTQTVLASYRALLANIGAFAGAALFWSFATVMVRAIGLALTETTTPEVGTVDILVLLAPYLLALIFAVAGSACLSIVWHRFLILGETPHRLFPADRDVIGPYFVRSTAAMAIPIGVVMLAAWAYRQDSESIVLAAVSYFAAPIILARMGRLLLVLPASAVGDTATTLRESLRVTKGGTTSLFLGLLACGLPLSLITFGLDQWGRTFGENSWEELTLAGLEGVVDLARNAIWTAFMSFAYLELVRPPEAQARHFS